LRSKKFLFQFSAGILLIILGIILAMHGSIHYRDISFLPMSLGVVVLFISLFRELGENSGMNLKRQKNEKNETKEAR